MKFLNLVIFCREGSVVNEATAPTVDFLFDGGCGVKKRKNRTNSKEVGLVGISDGFSLETKKVSDERSGKFVTKIKEAFRGVIRLEDFDGFLGGIFLPNIGCGKRE